MWRHHRIQTNVCMDSQQRETVQSFFLPSFLHGGTQVGLQYTKRTKWPFSCGSYYRNCREYLKQNGNVWIRDLFGNLISGMSSNLVSSQSSVRLWPSVSTTVYISSTAVTIGPALSPASLQRDPRYAKNLAQYQYRYNEMWICDLSTPACMLQDNIHIPTLLSLIIRGNQCIHRPQWHELMPEQWIGLVFCYYVSIDGQTEGNGLVALVLCIDTLAAHRQRQTQTLPGVNLL